MAQPAGRPGPRRGPLPRLRTHPRRGAARVVRSLVLAVAVLAAGAGCTPADQPVTAVRAVDGRPTLLVAACAVPDIDRISVYANGTEEFRDWTIVRESGPTPDAVRLLEVPEGWTVETELLTRFESDAEYGVSAFGGSRDAVPVHFTLTALTGLRPDQVLVGDSPSGWRVVSEREFQERAAESCG